ncbi:MAG: flagellar motor protein MotB [Vicinamibacterales bacterium]
MRRRRGGHRAGHDRWLVSYADLVTLLFAFFTVLYAGSRMDADSMAPVASSLQQAFDARPATPAAAETGAGDPALTVPVEVVRRERSLDVLQEQLRQDLADAVAQQQLEIVRDSRGLVLTLPERATFPVGTADASEAALALIGRVAEPLLGIPNGLRIEGHTDDVPISTARYRSNWELSTARAGAVVAFLLDLGFEPARLSAAGYAEFHPRAANDTPENRARNRRIDIVVLGEGDLLEAARQ